MLIPYRQVLDRFLNEQLVQRALTKEATVVSIRSLSELSAILGREWRIDVTPIFSMTQDQSAIVLESTAVFFSRNNVMKPEYGNVVRAVSNKRDGESHVEYWIENDGEMLKEAAAALFAEALVVLAQDAQ